METGQTMILQLQSLACGVPDRTLFQGLSLEIGPGESVAVVGRSGIGKSTLIATILGMRKPKSGRVLIAGKSMTDASSGAAAAIRREHVGVVFQHGELLPELTAGENVAVALALTGLRLAEALEEGCRAVEALGVVGDTSAMDLSGGERQRVAFARALASKPDLILADEPTGSLDEEMRDEIATEIFEVVRERQCGLLIVTHDRTVAARADARIDLQDYAEPGARGSIRVK